MDIQCGIDKGISHMYVGDIPKVKIRYPIGYPIKRRDGISLFFFMGYPIYLDKISCGISHTLKIEDIPIHIAKGISHTKPGISLRNRGYPPKNGDIPLVNLPDVQVDKRPVEAIIFASANQVAINGY